MNTIPQNEKTDNQVQVFNFTQSEVRTLTDENGEPLFCLADVAKVLDIQNTKSSRFNLKESGVHKMYLTDNLGRQQLATFLDERNLYRVIFRSNKPVAVKFQDWIYDEVIPTIRKTGQYGYKPDIATLFLLSTWVDKFSGEENGETFSNLRKRYDVTDLTEISHVQYIEAVDFLTKLIEDIIITNSEPKIELQQINSVVGMPTNAHNLRLALHSAISVVADCYIDKKTAHGVIRSRLEHACKLANIDWITHDRLSTALRELARITDEAVKHRGILQQIDNNAIVCMGVVNANNAIGYIN